MARTLKNINNLMLEERIDRIEGGSSPTEHGTILTVGNGQMFETLQLAIEHTKSYRDKTFTFSLYEDFEWDLESTPDYVYGNHYIFESNQDGEGRTISLIGAQVSYAYFTGFFSTTSDISLFGEYNYLSFSGANAYAYIKGKIGLLFIIPLYGATVRMNNVSNIIANEGEPEEEYLGVAIYAYYNSYVDLRSCTLLNSFLAIQSASKMYISSATVGGQSAEKTHASSSIQLINYFGELYIRNLTIQHTITAPQILIEDGSRVYNADRINFNNVEVKYSIPESEIQEDGAVIFDKNVPLTVKGRTGDTASRPLSPKNGLQYFDETLNKPIWYDGTNWIDSSGTIV